jgi:hypothetical protein
MGIHNHYVFGDITCDHSLCLECVEDVKVYLAEHYYSFENDPSISVWEPDGGVELPEGWTQKPYSGHLCPEHSPKEKEATK